MAAIQKNFLAHWGNTDPWHLNPGIVGDAVRKSDHYRALKEQGLRPNEIMRVLNTPVTMNILTAEGEKQSQILNAEGARQADILRAEGEAQAAVIRAEGEATAIAKVFKAIHDGDADEKILAYKYLEQLAVIANGNASKVWIIPAELSSTASTIARAFKDSQT